MNKVLFCDMGFEVSESAMEGVGGGRAGCRSSPLPSMPLYMGEGFSSWATLPEIAAERVVSLQTPKEPPSPLVARQSGGEPQGDGMPPIEEHNDSSISMLLLCLTADYYAVFCFWAFLPDS